MRLLRVVAETLMFRIDVLLCSLAFRHQVELTRDPVILNAMLYICKTMHDSVK